MGRLVSIIIPVYNGANYMREAIDSALAQTYPDIEIIVVNDGSRDNGATREIAMSYGDRIRYFEKENGGVSTALNLGIQNMKGEYFSWLSHDDLYLPEKIEIEMKAIQESGDMTMPVYSGWICLDMNTDTEYVYVDNECRFENKYFENGVTAVLLGLISGCSLLIHKSYFETYGLFDVKQRTTQDYDKWFHMFRGKKILYINKPLIKSRVHENQVGVTYQNFMAESDELFFNMVKELKKGDFADPDFSLYDLIAVAMLGCGNSGFLRAYELAKERIQSLEEPQNASDRRKLLQRYMKEHFGQEIYLYCIGRRGRGLLDAFYYRGIDVSGFSDSNEKLCDQVLRGVQGVRLEQIKKDSAIIVTKDHPWELVETIKEKGFRNVSTYNEIQQIIMETPVDVGRIVKG